MASEQRTRDASRIRVTTRWLLYGSVVATAVFGGLAAGATHARTSSNASGSSSVASSGDRLDDDGFGGAVPPASSSEPPVTQSGGS